MSANRDLSLQVLESALAGIDLAEGNARDFMRDVMAGKVTAARLAGVLVALRAKGESVGEITGFARAMRENAIPVPVSQATRLSGLVDTCGTGGDRSGTFNISTATALVVAAMGIPVAKHGNRAVSSRCGSADVLEALGVNIDTTPDQAARLIEEVGIGFLFAPRLHPAMKHAAPVRRELGVRTVFNILGPLTNPAGAARQLLGVFSPDLCEPLAQVLNRLGSRRAFVVHGAGGLDEVSPLGETRVAALEKGHVSTFTFHPEEAGIPVCRAEELAGGSAEKNAAIITDVLAGRESPALDAVLLNVGFVAVVTDRAADVAAGVDAARRTLREGHGMRLLARLQRATAAAKAPGKEAS